MVVYWLCRTRRGTVDGLRPSLSPSAWRKSWLEFRAPSTGAFPISAAARIDEPLASRESPARADPHVSQFSAAGAVPLLLTVSTPTSGDTALTQFEARMDVGGILLALCAAIAFLSICLTEDA